MGSCMIHLSKNKLKAAYLAAASLLFVAFFVGLACGAGKISLAEGLRAILAGDTQSTDGRILLYVRLPRVLGALLCGGALAASGAVIQGVLANRLASPSIVGVNAGAGLAVTVASALGVVGGLRLSLFAFLGALLAVMLVTLGARRFGASRGTVILLGVAMNAFLGAISDTVITLVPDVGIMSNDFKIGDFSAVTYPKLWPAACLILPALLLLITLSHELDLLALGEETARGLGLHTGRARCLLLLPAALLAGAAVSVGGLLSFVGLLVPHAVRRLGGTRARHLIPLSALGGAGFVALCDTLARVVAAPYELPVGILLAFLGAPFFILILIKTRGGRTDA